MPHEEMRWGIESTVSTSDNSRENQTAPGALSNPVDSRLDIRATGGSLTVGKLANESVLTRPVSEKLINRVA